MLIMLQTNIHIQLMAWTDKLLHASMPTCAPNPSLRSRRKTVCSESLG